MTMRTFGISSTSTWWSSAKDLQSAIPLTSLVGLISISYSWTFSIQAPLLLQPTPCYVNILLTIGSDTYITEWECNTKNLNFLSALTNAYACFSIFEYFNSWFINGILMKEIGACIPSLFSYITMANMVCSDA